MKHEHEEMLDLVDENDEIIGQKSRAEIYALGLQNFRVVNILLRNSKGELWIPRRTAQKKLFPSHLDMSAAGHVESGETYEEAAAKEVGEELNIDFNAVPHRTLGKLTPKDGINVFAMNYEITSDEVPPYNPDDFSEYHWLTPEDLLTRIDGGDKAKSHLPILIKQYYLA